MRHVCGCPSESTARPLTVSVPVRRTRIAALRRLAASACGFALIALTAGCPPIQPAGNNNGPDPRSAPNLDIDGNFTFETATPITLVDDKLVFSGRIDGSGDLDLFKLSATANPGDRIYISVEAVAGATLDPVLALFDENENLIAYNDDREVGDIDGRGANRNPLVDIVLPGEDPRALYVGIAQFFNSETTGQYVVDVRILRNVGGPTDAEGQVIFLEYRGGDGIRIPNVGTFNLPPFDAAQLGGAYVGQTTAMKRRIEQIVSNRYAGFNLIVLNSDSTPFPTGEFSTIYFGGFNERAFAIAQQIDTFNADRTDKAIIFTRSFEDAFSRTPTLEEMANAVGNTVAHEVGHLLGLVHTADCDDLMDATCGNNRLLSAQSFGKADLDVFVFPVGTQDAAMILEWVLGVIGL
jgi:hypothetical protein